MLLLFQKLLHVVFVLAEVEVIDFFITLDVVILIDVLFHFIKVIVAYYLTILLHYVGELGLLVVFIA